MRHALSLAILTVTACGEALPPAPPPTPPAPEPVASSTPVPSATASAAPAAPARSAAKMGAPVDGRFAHVVSCKAPGFLSLQVWAVGKGLLGICGMAVEASGVFYLPESGPPRLAPEVFKDVPMRTTREGMFGIYNVKGTDLDHVEADVTELMTRSGISYHFRKDGKQWRKTSAEAFEGSDWYCNGSCVEIGGKPLIARPADAKQPAHFEYLGEQQGWLPARAKVPGCDEPVGDFGQLFVRGKELWGIGSACERAATQRWTIGGTDTRAERLDLPARPSYNARLFNVGERSIYASGEGVDLALFDGGKWTPLGTIPGGFGVDVHAAGGKIWITTGKELHRLDGTRLVNVPVPDERIDMIRFSTRGDVRLWNGKALYALDADDVWHLVQLPADFGEVYELASVGDRWLVRGLRPDDKEEQHLAIEGASGPPLSIVDPNASISPIAYVRPMGPGCEQPFAMLYKLSKVAPKDYDFPATKKALAGHAELQAGRFSEVAALGDRYLVAQFDGPRARQRLAEVAKLVEKNVSGAKPQLLCADAVPGKLPTTRDISMK